MYDAPKCIRWRLHLERQRAEKALGEFEAVKIAKLKAELRLTQLKTGAIRRKYVKAEEAEEALSRQAHEIRTALEALPRRWAEKVRPTSPAEGEAIVEEMIRAIYDQLVSSQ
ncbi:MAG: hypothetical protein EB060_08635 [Proteobacteria bacterium]|nr:hypothetical protein [Pseudomonadota bacterium]